MANNNFGEEIMDKSDVTHESSTANGNGGVLSAGSASSDPDVVDDIEGQVNLYFQQLFDGQMSIKAMIDMLKGFQHSSVERERMILECIINNLFEEYRFFSKYPEAQLSIAAVLFGSLIKYQFVTHLTLGIALRGVLDALRRPADSKMFGFGTMALELFVDRLVEWPQYRNHILQISHLRAAHPQLVASIETTGT